VNQLLIDAMHGYFEAGGKLDLERLNQLYADDFQNVRMDRDGRTIVFTKPQFMMRFRQMKAQGAGYEPSDDIQFLHTDTYDDHASLVLRRMKEGKPVLYNFVWRLRSGQPTAIIREFTVEDDLSGLIAMVERLSATQLGDSASPDC